ncbi:hypothetical protein B0619_07230 [Campylobacter lari]|nr:hypothetical protein [Campylobacter lari]EAK5786998.1 hypothetical protein [Campylobacter lari]
MKNKKISEPSLFDFEIEKSFDEVVEKQKKVELNFKDEELICRKIEEFILDFDSNFPLKKCNFGTRFVGIRNLKENINENISINLSHPDLKVIKIKDYDNLFKYQEGSGKILVENLALKVEIEDKSNNFNVKFPVKYDFGQEIIDNEGYIIYYPGKIKITKENIEKELKIFKNILNYNLGAYENENTREQFNNRKSIGENNRESKSVLQESAQNVSISTSEPTSNQFEDFRRNSIQETTKEMEQNRLYKIRLNTNSFDSIKQLSNTKYNRTEINSERLEKLKEIEKLKEEIVNFLIDVKPEIEKQLFQKNEQMYSNLSQKMREKDMSSKIEEKIKNTFNHSISLNEIEKEKIINDFMLGIRTKSINNFSFQTDQYVLKLIENKIANHTQKLKEKNIDCKDTLDKISLLKEKITLSIKQEENHIQNLIDIVDQATNEIKNLNENNDILKVQSLAEKNIFKRQ